MPWTQADIDELRARIKKFAGVSSTSFDNQSTSFDHKAAQDLLSEMEREVNGRSRVKFASTSKGL